MLQLRFRHAAVVCLAATVLSGAGQATSNLDNNPRLVVPDQGNNRVSIYNHPVANGQRADVVLGQSSFSKATFGTSSTTMASPAAYAFDKNGNLYINPVRHLQDRNSLYLTKMGGPGFGSLPISGRPHPKLLMISAPRLLVLLCVLMTCGQAYSQDTNTLPDSPSHAKESAGEPPQSPTNRHVTWRGLPRSFLQDQKAIWWVFPGQLARGQHLLPTMAITGVTAGLIVADPYAMPYLRAHAQNIDDINDVFDPLITSAEVILVPASLMVAGYVRHDDYQVDTALLAGEAYADSAVVDLAIKAVSRRQRPSDVAPTGQFDDTFFAGGKSPFKGSSFPSGHAAGAFAVATVVATRYHTHRWVPWAAYGFATLVGLSRISTSAHFPSDVFLGAALGYTITRYQVLRPRQ